MARQTPDDLTLTYRKMRFDFEDEGFDKYWHDGSPFISLFWTALSTAFRPGEKFFMDSAQALRGETDDQAMDEEIHTFVRQEAHHTLQHHKFNQKNGEHGLDVKGCEARYKAVLDRAREKLDPMEQLAATMALEHFTAGFAHQYLTNRKLIAGADPKVTALWAWHAAEEAEHKGTCYDLYQKLGGGYFRRCIIMPGAWFMILLVTFINLRQLMKAEGQLGNWRDRIRGIRYLFGFHGLVTRMLPSFFAYFRPGFHPWEHDNQKLIEGWQQSNARYITNLPQDEAPAALPAAAAV